jgi:hypothetical protein
MYYLAAFRRRDIPRKDFFSCLIFPSGEIVECRDNLVFVDMIKKICIEGSANENVLEESNDIFFQDETTIAVALIPEVDGFNEGVESLIFNRPEEDLPGDSAEITFKSSPISFYRENFSPYSRYHVASSGPRLASNNYFLRSISKTEKGKDWYLTIDRMTIRSLQSDEVIKKAFPTGFVGQGVNYPVPINA